MPTDAKLLEAWASGDVDAGNQLFKRYFDSVYGFFQTKVDRDAEELVQATFMGCVQSIHRFRGASSFRTFLFSIARKRLYSFYRDKKRFGREADFNEMSVADMGTGAETHLGRAEDQRQLLQALCALPLEQQIMLELFYWENMSGQQIAEILDLTPGTVRTRLFRARTALRAGMVRLSQDPRYESMTIDDLDAWASAMRARAHAD